LRGRVIDAVSGEPVPWPSLSLTPDAVREVARASGDDAGIFDMPDVPTGTYLLRINKLGYQSVFVTIEHAAPPRPIDVTLQPDSVVMKGVALMTHEYRRRRNAVAASVRFIGEEQLRYSAAPSVRAFLEYEAGLFFSPCGPGSASPDCIANRGGVASPKLYIDDLQWDLDVLWSFNTSELHAVEVFRCRKPEIRLYTIEYLERMARRPRIPLPACSFW
jgi:hypothetical protein